MSIRRHLVEAAQILRGAAGALSFLPPLATRVTIGLGYLHTGLGKWHSFERTVDFFAGLGIPFARASAGLVASLEVVGGLLLLLGLLTRTSATLLAASMVVALLTADGPAFIGSWGRASEISPTDVASWVFLLYLLWLIAHGAGAVSVDRAVARWRGRGAAGR